VEKNSFSVTIFANDPSNSINTYTAQNNFMKQIIFSVIVISVFTSCGNLFGKRVRGDGHITTEARSLTGYNSIDVSGAIDVYVKQDSTQAVHIETDQNLMPYIVVREEGGILKIYPKDNSNLKSTGTIKVYVSGSNFRRFEASGASDYYSQNKITNTESIAIDMSGSSDANLELNSPKISAEVSGAGKLILKGETKDLKIDGTGASDFKCFDLQAENVSLDITGASDAEVFASVKLDVDITGASSVRYKGNPSINQRVSGSGSVRKVD
jgi:hypothetical protein